jgi:hypothetical protein
VKRNNNRSHSWSIVFLFVLISLLSTLYVNAQKSGDEVFPTLWEDTTKNPHDYTNRFYDSNGVNPKAIIGRRTGLDGLSVFGYTSNPNNSEVRVLITMPAYDEYGGVTFWYPLGELQYDGFTADDKIGANARELAKYYPIYVFPEPSVKSFNSIMNGRQAPLLDNSWVKSSSVDTDLNPLGIRQIRLVNYTEKAFGKEGFEMMDYFGKKNGLATDGTPLIRSFDDIQQLLKSELITADPIDPGSRRPYGGQYAVTPMIDVTTQGVIARDAFLWMSSRDGKWLPDEKMFLYQFNCMQKYGELCQ